MMLGEWDGIMLGNTYCRPLLEKIASQVKPIMHKRGWKVGTLAEVDHILEL